MIVEEIKEEIREMLVKELPQYSILKQEIEDKYYDFIEEEYYDFYALYEGELCFSHNVKNLYYREKGKNSRMILNGLDLSMYVYLVLCYSLKIPSYVGELEGSYFFSKKKVIVNPSEDFIEFNGYDNDGIIEALNDYNNFYEYIDDAFFYIDKDMFEYFLEVASEDEEIHEIFKMSFRDLIDDHKENGKESKLFTIIKIFNDKILRDHRKSIRADFEGII